MSHGVVSAVPERLIHYSDVAREVDANLQSTARRLRAQLEHFETRCVEPGFRVHASGQADALRQYANQCEPVDAWVRETGQQFQLADGRWGGAGSGALSGWFSNAWASLQASASAVSAGMLAGFVSFLAIPDWLQGKVAALPWTLQNYSEWMSDITKSVEFLGRYIAEHLNIKEADFDLSDVTLFLFSKSPWCNDSLRDKLEGFDDLKSAYGLVAKFSQANFMFFMAGILSNPERYIDPWLDKINHMTLFPNKPIGSGNGTTNLHGQNMSEMPRWMQILFGYPDQEHSPRERQGGVLGVSTIYAAEMSSDAARVQASDIAGMPLIQRRQWLTRVQTEVAKLDQVLADLRASGASEQLNSYELEQQIAALRQRRADLQSRADDWLNKVRVSEQGLKLGFDDGILDAPWQTRSDDFEREIQHLSEEISALEDRLPRQKQFDRTLAQLQTAEHTSHELETSLAEHWWNDVPAQSQRKLTYKGQKTAYGCTPTATSMVLDYWHNQDPTNKDMSAQELLSINAGQGEFTATGMSATRIHDEVKNLGYGVVQDHIGSDFETLREAVEQGPVIAIVKLNMATSGDNHVVVVTGVSPDGSQVRVNDPWTGQPHVYTREQFAQSWGANFGPGSPKNNCMVIRPS